jgi:hypothetical protein
VTAGIVPSSGWLDGPTPAKDSCLLNYFGAGRRGITEHSYPGGNRVAERLPWPSTPATISAMSTANIAGTAAPGLADRTPSATVAPSAPVRQTAAGLAAATPTHRDRYVDALRVVSIGVVVLGHWLMAVVRVGPSGEAVAGNVLTELPAARYATWLFQVMPLFFLIGGFANAAALKSVRRRGGSYADFGYSRTRRLLEPTVAFLCAWAGAAVALEVTGRDKDLVLLALHTIVQPLWFLGVYLGVVVLAPALYAWHRRHGAAVPGVLTVGAIAVDTVRFATDSPVLGVLNIALVWLAVHQLGYCWEDGFIGPRTAGGLAVGGLAALVVLTVVTGWYPISMVGVPGEAVSNMNPPTVALLAHAFWLTGAAVLVRERANQLLARPRVWVGVVAANGLVMTVFLWHLTALFAVWSAVIVLGVPVPAAGSAAWWICRPLWLGACAALTAALAVVFRRAERLPATPPAATAPPWAPAASSRRVPVVLGAQLTVSAGLLALPVTGLDGLLSGRSVTMIAWPMTAASALLLIGIGWTVLRLAPDRHCVRS